MDINHNFEFDSKRINKIAERWLDNVEKGEVEALKAYCLLKQAQDQLDQALKHIKNYAIAELERYDNKENILIDNKKIAIQNRRIWSYKHIAAWESNRDHLKKIEEAAKLAYQNNSSIVFDETGEMIEPAICKTSQSIIVTEVKNV